jgi:hypothetical protein
MSKNMSKMSKSVILMPANFYCLCCDYPTYSKAHYEKHLRTKKHLKKMKKVSKMSKSVVEKPKKSVVTHLDKRYQCIGCLKKYKTRYGLHYHYNHSGCEKKKKKTEKDTPVMVVEKKEDSVIMNSFLELVKQQNETNKLLTDTISKIGTGTTNTFNNCNNKNLTVNVYLNEHCKDALNLSDFAKNLSCSLEDLMYTKEHGYLKGLENIFTKQIEDLNPKERPIHCSDKKRLQFYIKDNNTWKKDEGGEHVDKVLTTVQTIQIKELYQWEQLHPNYMEDPVLLKEWQQIIHAVGGNINPKDQKKVVDKFKKTLAQTTSLKQAMKEENEDD